MNIIDEMALEAISDSYFLALFHKTELNYWQHVLTPQSCDTNYLSLSEYNDILTFADILSLSSTPEHRNIAIKIIGLFSVYLLLERFLKVIPSNVGSFKQKMDMEFI